MKTLASCKPSEFLRQTNRIRKSVERWLTETDIINIRKRMPEYEKADADATIEEKGQVVRRNAEKRRQQIRKNLDAIFQAVLEDHPDETLELLALLCFVEPEHVDDYPVIDYLNAFTELITDEAVLSFFTSLQQLGQMDILTSATK